MAYVMPRHGAKGVRYTAMYRTVEGRDRSAGTFDSEDEAMTVAKEKEAYERGPKHMTDPAAKASMTVAEYLPIFLAAHQVELTTKRGYESVLRVHVLPEWGHVRLRDLQREGLRHWIARKQRQGTSAVMMRHTKMALSAMLKTAWDDGYVSENAVAGLKSARVVRGKIAVMTTDQFKRVYDALPTDGSKALAHLVVGSGLRQGEALALRAGDIDMDTRILSVTKALTEPGEKYHPEGLRFFEKPYPKDIDDRFVKLQPPTLRHVQAYIERNGLKPGDVLFPGRLVKDSTRAFPKRIEGKAPVNTTPLFHNGREYQHGTLGGYTTAKCKCDSCMEWMRNYNRARGKGGKHAAPAAETEAAEERRTNPKDFVGRHDIQRYWPRAVREADLPIKPVAYQLRHTHAQWLYEKNWALTDIAKRLGHNDLKMIDKYVQVSDDALGALVDETPDLLDF